MSADKPEYPLSSAKARFLLASSPLVAGGKARLMSNRKVTPNRAKPREVSKVEAEGYTTEPHKALNREPECVGPAIVDGYAESARFYDSLRHVAEVEAAQQARKLLSAEKRLQDAQRRAKQSHVTVLGREFAAMRDMIERSKAGGRKDSPAVIRKLESAEAHLDGLNEAA